MELAKTPVLCILTVLRNLIIRVSVNNIVMARFKNENNAVFGIFLQRLNKSLFYIDESTPKTSFREICVHFSFLKPLIINI